MLKGIFVMPHAPVLISEVGRGRERKAYKTLRGIKELTHIITKIKPDHIVCITPHGNNFSDGIAILDKPVLQGSLKQFGCPEVNINKKTEDKFLAGLDDYLFSKKVPSVFLDAETAKEYDADTSLDHGTVVPLYFIDKVYKNYTLTTINTGTLPLLNLYQIGKFIGEYINGCGLNTLIIASGELSHCLGKRGDAKSSRAGAAFDKTVVNSIKKNDFFDLLSMPENIYEPAKECGLSPLITALGAVDASDTSSKVYSYEAPFDIGYMTAFIETRRRRNAPSLLQRYRLAQKKKHDLPISDEDDYITLARTALTHWVDRKKQLNWQYYKKDKAHLSEFFIHRLDNLSCGVFVSLYKNGECRGCMGTVSPSTPYLGKEIIYNTVQAAEYDPRFTPVASYELPYIEIQIDILSSLEKVRNIKNLNPEKYGILVEKDTKRGLLLPALKGIKTARDQIKIAKQKAGIVSDRGMTVYRFSVERHRARYKSR